MNCHTIQNKILNLTDPRVIPVAFLNHVSECEVCRAWAKQAARLEALLAQLPVPPAPGNKKNEMLDELTSGGLVISRPLTVPERQSLAASIRRILDQNRTVIGGIAAVVLVVLCGWWILTGNGEKPSTSPLVAHKDPFLEKMVHWDVALAKASSPRDRLVILSDMADGLSNQTRSLARVANKDELADLARWYDKVVKVGLVRQADKMPVATMTLDERAKCRDQLNAIAKQLGDTAGLAERMTEIPEDAKPAFQKIMKSAREGEQELRKLANES
jgi:hypothetical protein